MSNSGLPSGDDFFGGASTPQNTLPTSDQFFGTQPQVKTGAAHDAFWANPLYVGHQLLNAFGVGGTVLDSVKDPIGLTPEQVSDARSKGFFNDYEKGEHNAFKATNEALFRPIAAGVDIGSRILAAPFSGAAELGQSLAKETEKIPYVGGPLAIIPGGLGEIAGAIPQGFLPELGGIHPVDSANRARAIGTVGEGEEGHFETVPLTPENVTARAQAAKASGSDAPITQPVVTDVHQVARNVDPETFDKFDTLTAAREEHQAALDSIAKRVDSGEDVPIHEILDAKNALATTDDSIHEITPDIETAYRHAQDIMPEPQAPKVSPEGKIEPQARDKETALSGDIPFGYEPPSLEAEALNREFPKIPTEGEGKLKPVEGTGELKTRGLSQGVEAKAIENNLTTSFGDLPEYRSLSMEDQAAKAAELINSDYETARAVAMGEKPPPAGLLPESVLVAVEKKALQDGDIETLRQLATNSGLSAEATTMGQRIRTLAERDPSSPVGAIKTVQDARAAALEKRGTPLQKMKAETTKQIRSSVRKSASPVPTWTDFIRSIECAE